METTVTYETDEKVSIVTLQGIDLAVRRKGRGGG